MISIPDHIKKLTPYKAGKPIEDLIREKGLTKIVKLASNENPLGASPKAVEAIKNNLDTLHRYTNPSSYKLVHAIAKKYKKDPAQIVCSSGSDSILQFIITAFTDEDDELLTSEGTFIGWYVNANKYGRKIITVPLINYHYDLDEIANKVNSKTKIIYLANPNNPTGTMFTKNEFDSFLKKIPNNILIVLDEAYTIYAEELNNYPNGLNYVLENLIVVRTLSKAYGLAGIRLGFAIGPSELIKEIYKVKLPFEPNGLAQAAGIAALDDEEFLLKTKKLNQSSLKKMKNKFEELGLKFIPTAANFFLILFSSEQEAIEFNDECLNRGLILRHVDTFGIPNGIRINSGTEAETDFALNVVEEVNLKLNEKYKLTLK